ncbi:MAG: alpha/beta fold hydrolase, partial [Actinobacteria bacterium]|nr:alpha/beta fold hydrolase [Actinomycetota bacterium]
PNVAPPAPDQRSMVDIFERLEQVPFNPVRPLTLGMLKALISGSIMPFLNAKRSTSAVLLPYPEEFEDVTFESFDGTPLAAVVGIHEDGKRRPGLVISHGMMSSKNDPQIQELFLTAYAGWGFNVLAIDLRNFGKSQSLSHTPSTAGWKEGEDLLAAAKYLAEMPEVTSVGITGFSMGAGSTMRAAYSAKEYPYLTGGAVAWNGYSDARRQLDYIDTKPPVTHPFYPAYWSFVGTQKLRKDDMKDYVDDPETRAFLDQPFKEFNFENYVEKITAPHYGVTADEVFSKASSKEYLADIEVPLLIIHAADDPICPPSEMDDLMEPADGNPNVNVWMMWTGNHCGFRWYDRNWFETVLRDFFTYWATWE